MIAPPLLVEAVRQVLKLKAKEGETTKHDAVLMVHGKIEKAGGLTKFGVGAAMVRMAALQIIETEVSRQLKMDLTEHEWKHGMPANGTPFEIIAAIGRTPRWIAIEEGADAMWKFSLTASPEHWMANAKLKYKKAQQTVATARVSEEIALFLTKHSFNSIAEAMTKGV